MSVACRERNRHMDSLTVSFESSDEGRCCWYRCEGDAAAVRWHLDARHQAIVDQHEGRWQGSPRDAFDDFATAVAPVKRTSIADPDGAHFRISAEFRSGRTGRTSTASVSTNWRNVVEIYQRGGSWANLHDTVTRRLTKQFWCRASGLGAAGGESMTQDSVREGQSMPPDDQN